MRITIQTIIRSTKNSPFRTITNNKVCYPMFKTKTNIIPYPI